MIAGQEAIAAIDAGRRDAIRRNHTGTHVLHWALREVLGEHVKQAGSLVAPDRLRFDFSHYAALSPEEIERIEDLANGEVLSNDPVRAYETTKAEAEAMGAIAFFGDKYGEVVRVLEAGRHSLELCGGTHVRATGDIGTIKVVSEGSIGSNLRRIEAVTGTNSVALLQRDERELARAAQLLGTSADTVVDGIGKRLEEIKSLRDELRAAAGQSGHRSGGRAGRWCPRRHRDRPASTGCPPTTSATSRWRCASSRACGPSCSAVPPTPAARRWWLPSRPTAASSPAT